MSLKNKNPTSKVVLSLVAAVICVFGLYKIYTLGSSSSEIISDKPTKVTPTQPESRPPPSPSPAASSVAQPQIPDDIKAQMELVKKMTIPSPSKAAFTASAEALRQFNEQQAHLRSRPMTSEEANALLEKPAPPLPPGIMPNFTTTVPFPGDDSPFTPEPVRQLTPEELEIRNQEIKARFPPERGNGPPLPNPPSAPQTAPPAPGEPTAPVSPAPNP